MRSLCWASCMAFSLAAASGCVVRWSGIGVGVRGSGVAAVEQRDVGAFSKVRFQGGGQLNVAVGDTRQVTVEVDDNLIGLVETVVENDTLVIRNAQNIDPQAGLHVTIVAPALEGISIAGASDAEIRGIDTQEFEVDIAGAADLRVSGSAEKLHVRVAGSGHVDASELATQDVAVRIAGSASVEVHAEAQLSVNISGSGDVRYSGQPHIERHITGSGSVQPLAGAQRAEQVEE
jgi:hypothetical protein